jgi:hypothetical protein
MPAITNQLSLGEPHAAGALAVFPVFGPEPRLDYRAFTQALELGAFVKELDEGASVGNLLVENPTDLPLLVYEGEEVLGAQQNRTFDSSTLVAAGAKLRLPVSCVERGRWDGLRSGERMVPSPQAADPSLRRVKRESANLRAVAGAEVRADQMAVWNAVDDRLSAAHVASDSDAMSDLYTDVSDDLDELVAGVRHEHGQIGAVAQVGGRSVVLDLASSADVFAALLPRLARGYALEAHVMDPSRPDRDGAVRFASAAFHAPRSRQITPGMGECFGIVAPDIAGSGLKVDGELIQLSAFPRDAVTERAEQVHGRIARPAIRRPA